MQQMVLILRRQLLKGLKCFRGKRTGRKEGEGKREVAEKREAEGDEEGRRGKAKWQILIISI